MDNARCHRLGAGSGRNAMARAVAISDSSAIWDVLRLSRNTAVGVSRFAHNTLHGFGFAVAVVRCFLSVVRSGSPTMSIFAYRKHLRFLSPVQRRRWWDQKKRLKPRVQISRAYVPPSVTREFAYVKVG
jgi:hypothetical protein